MIGFLRRLLAPAPPRQRRLRARYDAAQTNTDNSKHWANADDLSANVSHSAAVRQTLRKRARYEVANNSYARGIVLTLANDTVGTGPRLQMLLDDPAANAQVESAWTAWASAIGLAAKLRTMRMAACVDGEAFGLLYSNAAQTGSVTLDLLLVETEQVAFPTASLLGDDTGILTDAQGNVTGYSILRTHPGDNSWRLDLSADTYPAARVLHYMRVDRPGQLRGVPELTAALPLFAQLRRYTLAVVAAAEAAADFAMVIKTNSPANGVADELESMDVLQFEKRMATVLPGGWDVGQAEARQPTTTYGDFKHELLNEIARCLNMPYNVAAANSSGYNYASGRLDHQVYFKSLRVEQSRIEAAILDRLLAAWLTEASLAEGLLPQSLRRSDAAPAHQWFWDGQEHVDPAKEATAQATRLQSHTTTLAYEFARQGRDWEAEVRQRAKELALMKTLGLPDTAATPARSAPVEEPEDA